MKFRLSFILNILAMGALVVGCAHGNMGEISHPLAKGSIDKSQTIYVEHIKSNTAAISGDKAADNTKVNEERYTIESMYSTKIVDALKAKGFKAQIAEKPIKKGIVLSGEVTKFEHGSAAARWFVGMGAGASKLFANFKIEDRTKGATISQFEIVATSGGESGLGSYMEKHINDGAKKVAEYISTQD